MAEYDEATLKLGDQPELLTGDQCGLMTGLLMLVWWWWGEEGSGLAWHWFFAFCWGSGVDMHDWRQSSAHTV